MTDEMGHVVTAVRAFNRFYTHQAGLLQEGLAHSPFTLAQARVLYEIAYTSGPTAAAIGRALGLDAGYLSRILAGLARQGLILRQPAPDDGRQRLLALSPRGQEIFAALEQSQAAQVADLLGGLGQRECADLTRAMATVRRLLEGRGRGHGVGTASAIERPGRGARAIRLRPPAPGDLGWIVERHGAVYARDYGWDDRFEGLVAGIVGDFAKAHDPKRERCWIAELDGRRVGCIMLVRGAPLEAGEAGKLRLLLVEPEARGHGLGLRLVEACLSFAREAGYRGVELWTNDILHAARRIYEKVGFVRTAREAHESFGQSLVAETWWLPFEPDGARPAAFG